MSRLEISVAETYGEEAESILQTAKLWQKNVSAIFGPVETCIHEVNPDRELLYVQSPNINAECLGKNGC